MQTLNDVQQKKRKPYVKPTVTKLTPEQAKLRLVGLAMMGDKGARELLELTFPNFPNTKKAS